jgi:hypothetical protein
MLDQESRRLKAQIQDKLREQATALERQQKAAGFLRNLEGELIALGGTLSADPVAAPPSTSSFTPSFSTPGLPKSR